MPDQNWTMPTGSFQSSSNAEAPPLPAQAMRYELRPLSTGEVLDRTFFLYRANFWLFTGISAMTAAVMVLGTIAKLIWLHFAHQGNGSPTDLALTGFMQLPGFAVYSITQAATTAAVSAIYLGQSTSAVTALRRVRGRWLRFIAIALWQLFSAFWMFLALVFPASMLLGFAAASKNTLLSFIAGLLMFLAVGSLVYGVIAYIRNSLAIPAAVVEGLKIRASMRRSKHLVAGRKGRIFLLLLLLLALYLVAGGLQVPLAALLLRSASTQRVVLQAITLVVGFVTNTVVSPVGAIALCLFYIDERVRKEGFDIEFLMDRTLGGEAEPAALSSNVPDVPSADHAPEPATAAVTAMTLDPAPVLSADSL